MEVHNLCWLLTDSSGMSLQLFPTQAWCSVCAMTCRSQQRQEQLCAAEVASNPTDAESSGSKECRSLQYATGATACCCLLKQGYGLEPTDPDFPVAFAALSHPPAQSAARQHVSGHGRHQQQLLLGPLAHSSANKQDRPPQHDSGYRGHSEFPVTNHWLLLSQKYYIKLQRCSALKISAGAGPCTHTAACGSTVRCGLLRAKRPVPGASCFYCPQSSWSCRVPASSPADSDACVLSVGSLTQADPLPNKQSALSPASPFAAGEIRSAAKR